MMLRGRGYKRRIIRAGVRLVKVLDFFSLFHNTPRKLSRISELPENGNALTLFTVYGSEKRSEAPPIIWNHTVTRRFSRLFERNCPEAFVAQIQEGKVAGDSSNWIISRSGKLITELSREFGAYGGKNLDEGVLICDTLRFKKLRRIDASVAVISTCGFNNFHHWNYDSMPRLHLLKQVAALESIDFFVIHHSNLSFQRQSLLAFGIPDNRILKLEAGECLQARTLWVPSLPSPLGTVSPWVIRFLRGFYLSTGKTAIAPKRMYISRKNVVSRHIQNNGDFLALLRRYGFQEVFPEDYSVSEMAAMVADAECIVSVHGSGLANLCFIREGTVVIDILAPYHQDGYYWQITNLCKGKYIGFFAEGEHPNDDLDLVRAHIDNDLFLDINGFEQLINKELKDE